MMFIVCFKYMDKREYLSVHNHWLAKFLIVKRTWYAKTKTDISTEILFLDFNGRIIEDDVLIKDIPRRYSWVNLVEIIVKSYQYVIDQTRALEREINSTEQPSLESTKLLKVWKVEPTVGQESFGRWIVHPNLNVKTDINKTKFSIACYLRHPQKDNVEWLSIELDFKNNFLEVRRILAEKLNLELTDVAFGYSLGGYYKQGDHLKHLTFTGHRDGMHLDIIKRNDESLEAITQETINDTMIPYLDDSVFLIAPFEQPLVVFLLKNDFLCVSSDNSFKLNPLSDNRTPMTDEKVVAFMDGILLKDRRPETSTLDTVFVSWDAGEQYTDIATGEMFESQKTVLESSTISIPESHREWRHCVVLFYADEILPKWRLPQIGYLDLMIRDGDCLNIRDETIVRSSVTGKTDKRWKNLAKLPPDDSQIHIQVTNHMRSKWLTDSSLEP